MVRSFSPGETENVGRKMAEGLRGGEVIALRGGLGAGKTAFVRGLAAGLGYQGRVQSPTFTIVNEYIGGRLPLFHFDLYRLGSEDELFEIGWEDYLERGGVCALEWSENAGEALEESVRVTLRRISDEEREIEITGGRI